MTPDELKHRLIEAHRMMADALTPLELTPLTLRMFVTGMREAENAIGAFQPDEGDWFVSAPSEGDGK